MKTRNSPGEGELRAVHLLLRGNQAFSGYQLNGIRCVRKERRQHGALG